MTDKSFKNKIPIFIIPGENQIMLIKFFFKTKRKETPLDNLNI